MTREELLKIAKPILFNTDMVKAILDGRKTVTRRIVKPPYYVQGDEKDKRTLITQRVAPKGSKLYREIGKMPYPDSPYQISDILYVRETWRVGAWDIQNQMIAFDYKDGACGKLVHISNRERFERLVNQSREDAWKAKCEYNGADFIWEKGKSPCRWHPSIHMPKEAARIFLQVKDVRVERLQDIDDKGAYEEGAGEKNAIYQIGGRVCDFVKIWNKTIKKTDLDLYGWEANPWVWVIEFEKKEI